MRRAALAALLWALTSPAFAQPGTAPARELDKTPHVVIGNGLISARVHPPGEKSLYKGTRFDHSGVLAHIISSWCNSSNFRFFSTLSSIISCELQW